MYFFNFNYFLLFAILVLVFNLWQYYDIPFLWIYKHSRIFEYPYTRKHTCKHKCRFGNKCCIRYPNNCYENSAKQLSAHICIQSYVVKADNKLRQQHRLCILPDGAIKGYVALITYSLYGRLAKLTVVVKS